MPLDIFANNMSMSHNKTLWDEQKEKKELFCRKIAYYTPIKQKKKINDNKNKLFFSVGLVYFHNKISCCINNFITENSWFRCTQCIYTVCFFFLPPFSLTSYAFFIRIACHSKMFLCTAYYFYNFFRSFSFSLSLFFFWLLLLQSAFWSGQYSPYVFNGGRTDNFGYMLNAHAHKSHTKHK